MRFTVSFKTMLLAFLFISPGCGGSTKSTYAVTGKVLYKDAPPVGAVVLFHPVGADATVNKPYGTVTEDGTFRLTTYSNKPDGGAPAGEYKVSIYWPGEPKQDTAKPGKMTMGGNERAETTNKLPEKYRNPETSGLTVTVKSENNTLEPFILK